MNIGELNTIPIDGVYTHPSLSPTEQTLLEITGGSSVGLLFKINLDVSALLLNTTFRLYCKVDGSTYRLRYGTGVDGGTIAWTTSDGPWIAFSVVDILDHDIKVTIDSSGLGEAVSRDIPYSYNCAK